MTLLFLFERGRFVEGTIEYFWTTRDLTLAPGYVPIIVLNNIIFSPCIPSHWTVSPSPRPSVLSVWDVHRNFSYSAVLETDSIELQMESSVANHNHGAQWNFHLFCSVISPYKLPKHFLLWLGTKPYSIPIPLQVLPFWLAHIPVCLSVNLLNLSVVWNVHGIRLLKLVTRAVFCTAMSQSVRLSSHSRLNHRWFDLSALVAGGDASAARCGLACWASGLDLARRGGLAQNRVRWGRIRVWTLMSWTFLDNSRIQDHNGLLNLALNALD